METVDTIGFFTKTSKMDENGRQKGVLGSTSSGGSRISKRWGHQPYGGHQHTILSHFPMKWKKFGPRGGARPNFTM